MEVQISKITAKGQTTIPSKVRQALGLKSGDRILFEEEGDKIVLKRFTTVDVLHLRYLENLLSPEWNSEEDNKAFNDL